MLPVEVVVPAGAEPVVVVAVGVEALVDLLLLPHPASRQPPRSATASQAAGLRIMSCPPESRVTFATTDARLAAVGRPTLQLAPASRRAPPRLSPWESVSCSQGGGRSVRCRTSGRCTGTACGCAMFTRAARILPSRETIEVAQLPLLWALSLAAVAAFAILVTPQRRKHRRVAGVRRLRRNARGACRRAGVRVSGQEGSPRSRCGRGSRPRGVAGMAPARLRDGRLGARSRRPERVRSRLRDHPQAALRARCRAADLLGARDRLPALHGQHSRRAPVACAWRRGGAADRDRRAS